MIFRIILSIFAILASGCDLLFPEPVNNLPVLEIQVEDETPHVLTQQAFTAIVSDADGESVDVTWETSDGILLDVSGHLVYWEAPDFVTEVLITATATDSTGGVTIEEKYVHVQNTDPTILNFSANKDFVLFGNSINLSCNASDADTLDSVHYYFYNPVGLGIFTQNGTGNASWRAPFDVDQGRYNIIVEASDGYSQTATRDTIDVLVYTNFGSLWISDSGNDAVLKYTSNGYQIFAVTDSLSKPMAVTSNIEESYGCYVSDYEDGRIIKINEEGEIDDVYDGYENIVALSIHNDSWKIFALSNITDMLYVIDGRTGSNLQAVSGFNRAESMTINQNTGDVWVANSEGNNVVQFNVSTIPETVDSNSEFFDSTYVSVFDNNFDYPTQVSMRNDEFAPVYVSDKNNNRLVKFLYNYESEKYEISEDISGFTQPTLLNVNTQHKVWTFADEGLVVFNETTPNNRTFINSIIFNAPKVLESDPNTGDCWVADNGAESLVLVNYLDHAVLQIDGFSFIEDMTVNK